MEKLFIDGNPTSTGRIRSQVILTDWPDLPSVERLSPRKTPHHSLSPILENEGTISGTYNVIDEVFTQQLGYNHTTDFNGRLYLVYSDQKTVSLIRTVQKERQEVESTLYYNKNYLSYVQGYKSPFHHKEEVVTRAFDARVTALFYRLLPQGVYTAHPVQVNNYIRKLSRATFLDKVKEIRQYIFRAIE